VTTVPTQAQYEKKLKELNDMYVTSQKHIAEANRKIAKSQRAGNSRDNEHRDRAIAIENELISRMHETMGILEQQTDEYQTNVARLTKEKQTRELNEELLRQQKILEDNIKRTYELEAEKFKKIVGAERAKQIIPTVDKIENIPENEPLAILDKLEMPKQQPDILLDDNSSKTIQTLLIVSGIILGIIIILRLKK
jgi:molecular chaperone GrpE (heat shock protein)